MKLRVFYLILVLMGISLYLGAQPEQTVLEKIEINGEIVTAIITEDDTLYIADLENVRVTSPREFVNRSEYLTYRRYRSYANKVYPYAVEAIKVFRDLEENTQELNRGKRRRYAKKLHKRLKDNFEDPLKQLTKTQGRILVHMIEKELETPMYYLIKNLRGGLSARYWDTSGRLFGYRLRRGYIRGEDPVMDMVLDDFNISYDR